MSDEIKYPSQLAERFQVRMPDGLRDRLREAAEANRRSMNAEIVARLESTFPLYASDPDFEERSGETVQQAQMRVFKSVMDAVEALMGVSFVAGQMEAEKKDKAND